MLILSAMKIFAFLLVRQSQHTPGPFVLVPSCFEQNFYGIALGLGFSHMTPYDFFLAVRVSECVAPFVWAMVLYGLCIYSGGETGNFDLWVKFYLEGKSQPPKTIGILTKLFSIFGDPGLNGSSYRLKLSHGQAQGWQTVAYEHMDRHRREQQQYAKAKTDFG